MMSLLLVICVAACAFQAIRVKRLLQAAIWLAAASALTSLLLYLLAAPQAAVIELSVGAGLVFILFVFAINLSPGEAPSDRSVVPVALSVTMTGCLLLLLGELVWPLLAGPAAAAVAGTTLSSVLWHDRQLDVLVQVALIFVGALTVAGLLAPEREASEAATGQAQATPERARPAPPIPALPTPARPRPAPAAFTPSPAAPAALAGQKEKIA
jgi:uncharacterized MnhB-related membrane protein